MLLSIEEAAAALAVSVEQVEELIVAGELRAVKICVNRRIDERDIDAYRLRCNQTATPAPSER